MYQFSLLRYPWIVQIHRPMVLLKYIYNPIVRWLFYAFNASFFYALCCLFSLLFSGSSDSNQIDILRFGRKKLYDDCGELRIFVKDSKYSEEWISSTLWIYLHLHEWRWRTLLTKPHGSDYRLKRLWITDNALWE